MKTVSIDSVIDMIMTEKRNFEQDLGKDKIAKSIVANFAQDLIQKLEEQKLKRLKRADVQEILNENPKHRFFETYTGERYFDNIALLEDGKAYWLHEESDDTEKTEVLLEFIFTDGE